MLDSKLVLTYIYKGTPSGYLGLFSIFKWFLGLNGMIEYQLVIRDPIYGSSLSILVFTSTQNNYLHGEP